jgi:HK97 family phage prohead protease
MKIKKLDFDFEVKDMSDEGSFSGYGAIFNNLDHGSDIIMPGAFAKSLIAREQKGRNVPMLWQHNPDIPVGHYVEIREDAKGLFVKGQLDLEVAKAREAKSLMKNKIISGLSVGYQTKKATVNSQTGVRTLIELDLHEISLVTFPMNDDARIDSIKKRVENGCMPLTLADFEKLLRDAGFSKKNATIIANDGIKKLLRSDSGSETAIIESLQGFKLPTF